MIKKYLRYMAVAVVWLLIWQLAAMAVPNKIVFAGPWDTAEAFFRIVGTLECWRSILWSFLRIAAGFLTAFCAGIVLAALSGRFHWLRELQDPFVGALQSVPVASFVILALIWIGSFYLSVLVVFLVVFPVIYRNVLEGIDRADPQMLEMAALFSLTGWRKIWYLYRPEVMPYLLAGCRISAGMAWKSGVAAEVIGVTGHSIGEKLYMAKIYLSTDELFAWTILIVLVSWVFQKLFLTLFCRFGTEGGELSGRKRAFSEQSSRAESHGAPEKIRVCHLEKAYDGKAVLQDLSFCMEKGGTYCLMGASGCGKTTLLRLLAGLEQPDGGTITGLEHKKISMVFQEDRLFTYLSGPDNVWVTAGRSGSWYEPETLLDRLSHPGELAGLVSRMSGGMKRRVTIARALAFPSDVLLLDEPFNGLDQQTKENAIRVLKDCQRGRTMLLVTHQEQDAVLLNAKMLRLSERA